MIIESIQAETTNFRLKAIGACRWLVLLVGVADCQYGFSQLSYVLPAALPLAVAFVLISCSPFLFFFLHLELILKKELDQ